MESRIEDILSATISGESYNKPLESRIEKLLIDLKDVIEAGGGGGTSIKYGSSIEVEINSSTYVMTTTLKDQNGDTLGTAQTVDLPLETMVVGGSYDSTNKKVVLTLKNGETVGFSVADLVVGLQTELSSSNKLDPEFINYDSNHRAVSDTEKTTWNAKQTALSFDGTYNASSNKAATVSTVTNAVSSKANTSDLGTAAYTASTDYATASQGAKADTSVQSAGTGLSKSGTTLNHSNSVTSKTTQSFAQIAYDAQGHITDSTAATTAQLNAIDSGIDSTKVEQIETNKNNISTDEAALVELVDGGAKNLINQADDSFTSANKDYYIALPAGDYVVYFGTLSSTDTDATSCQIVFRDESRVVSNLAQISRGSDVYGEISLTAPCTKLRLFASDSAAHGDGDTCTFTNIMLCTKAAWDISQTYRPYRPYVNVNGIRLYVSSTAPTGDIPDGSVGVGW